MPKVNFVLGCGLFLLMEFLVLETIKAASGDSAALQIGVVGFAAVLTVGALFNKQVDNVEKARRTQ